VVLINKTRHTFNAAKKQRSELRFLILCIPNLFFPRRGFETIFPVGHIVEHA